MNTHSFKLKTLTTCIAALMVTACSSDNPEQPKHSSDNTPETLNMSNFVPKVESAGQTANWWAADAQVADGQLYRWQVLDANGDLLPVSGLDKFATHPVSLTANPATIQVPNPDACPGDADYWIEEKVANNVVSLAVSNTLGKASVHNGDTLELFFNIPENRYGVTYDATLNYADKNFSFNLTTEDLTDTAPDALKFKSEASGYTGPGVTKTNLANESGAGTGKDFVLTNVADNQLIKFELDGGVLGLNEHYKINFTSMVSGQTFVYDFEQHKFMDNEAKEGRSHFEFEHGETYPAVWTTVKSALSDNINATTYDSCATLGNDIDLYIAIPDKTFGETYTATIQWPNENGEMEDYTFSVTSAAEDREVDPIDLGTLYDISPSLDHIIEIPITGTNAKLPISVAGTGISYSIDGGEYTTDAGEIDEGQTLSIKYSVANLSDDEKYYAEFTPSITIGDQTFDGYARTEADPAWARLDAGFAFPSAGSATDKNAIKIRGYAGLVIPDDFDSSTPSFTESNLLVSVNGGDYTPVNTYADGTWTHLVDLTDGENTISFKTKAPQGLAESSPSQIIITKLVGENQAYPSVDFKLSHFEAIAVDTQQSAHTYYLLDTDAIEGGFFDNTNKNDDIIFKFIPGVDSEPSSVYAGDGLITNTQYVFDIAINNHRTTDDANYVLRTEHWQSMNVTDLSQSFPTESLSDGRVSGANSANRTRGAVFSEKGDIAFTANINGLGYHVFEYSADKPFDNTNPNTFVQYVTQDIAELDSIDNYVDSTGQEYLIANEVNNSNVWIIKLNHDDLAASTFGTVSFTHPNGTAFDGSFGGIAVDDKTSMAYIADAGNIFQFSLANIDDLIAGTATAEITAKFDGTFGDLTGLELDHGMHFMVAADNGNKAMYAIDQTTDEVVYLINAPE